ncbi:MAG TPA: DUF899 family protein [Caulobacteraceae bacterium]|nr:DUF899 family protein [Caulobacteraceae bacterium]
MNDAATSSLHDKRFPGEDAAYRQARDALLLAEMALRRQDERVAALRRALPPGGLATDYVFEEGEDGRPVKLSELFGAKQTLLLYSYMYGPTMERPCPSCSSMLDGLDGQAPHITQRVALAVVARSPIARLRAAGAERGWCNLHLISSANNSYHGDYHSETADGSQRPIMNVFSRRGGELRHVWASELAFAPMDPGQDPRHIDQIWPLWNALDYTPEGRGDFHPKLEYA